MRTGRPPILDLEPYRPRTPQQARELRRALIEAGSARDVAGNLAWCLLEHDELHSAQKWRFRKELLRLDGPPWSSPETVIPESETRKLSAQARVTRSYREHSDLRAAA